MKLLLPIELVTHCGEFTGEYDYSAKQRVKNVLKNENEEKVVFLTAVKKRTKK